jgi:HlyD family secretion protein
MKKRKFIVWGIIILFCSAGLYFYFSRHKETKVAWKTARVEKGNITSTVTATGSVNALTTVQVGAQVSGTISKLFADFNSVVKKGQLIALIDTTLLAASEQDASAALERTNVQLQQMKLEFDRVKKLFEGNALAQADYDLANTNYESAKSAVKSAQAQYSRSKINVQYAAIRAPISGVVISRNVDVGQTVISSFNTPTLFTIANDLTKMQVFANVDEADIGQIKVGQNVTFTVDAYPNETFSGEVNQVRLQPNLVQNVVNYTVVINVPNPDLKLLPGLTANITFKINEHKDVLKVLTNVLHFTPPEEYIDKMPSLPDSLKQYLKNKPTENIMAGGTAHIWKKSGSQIIPCLVRIGLVEGGYAEISGDVKAGDEIIAGTNKEENATSSKNPFLPTFRQNSKKSQ